MPDLADCITGVFSPLNTTASSGATPVKPILATILDPENYDPETLTYSLDFSKFYDAFYLGMF